MAAEADHEPEYTEAMDRAMRASIAQLRHDLSSQMDTDAHLRRVRELADPAHTALEVGHGVHAVY